MNDVADPKRQHVRRILIDQMGQLAGRNARDLLELLEYDYIVEQLEVPDLPDEVVNLRIELHPEHKLFDDPAIVWISIRAGRRIEWSSLAIYRDGRIELGTEFASLGAD